MATNVFIRLPLRLHAFWLPPPCGVFWSLLPFSLPRWFDLAWQPLPRRWTSSGDGLVRSATARESPRTVCCRSRDPAGYRRMPIPGFGFSCPSANWGTIISDYIIWALLYVLKHYSNILKHDYIDYYIQSFWTIISYYITPLKSAIISDYITPIISINFIHPINTNRSIKTYYITYI